MKSIIFTLLIYFVLLLTVAQADCFYDGQAYPTGTTINGKVCQPDGSWD